MITGQDHVVNFELLKMARQSMGGFAKSAFVPAGGDPSGGGGGAPPPGGDPSGGGGAPPSMDPSAGGAPPGGGGGMDPSMLQPMIQQAVQQAMMQQGGGQGGAAGGAGGAIKPKIDQNMVSVQILKALARICDHLGIQVPMSDMVPGMGDLNQLAQATQGQAPMPGTDPGGGAGGGGQAPAIGGIDPMAGMAAAGQPGAPKQGSDRPLRLHRGDGTAFDPSGLNKIGLDSSGLSSMGDRAAAIARTRRAASEVA